MKYTMDEVQRGVAAYVDNEFMPHLNENPLKKVLIGAAISIAIKRYSAMVPLLSENAFVKALNVFDSDGHVDVETLLGAVKQQMPKDGVPVDIPSIGTIRLHDADADKLMQYISQAAK